MKGGRIGVALAVAGVLAGCGGERDLGARAGEARKTYRKTQRAYDGAPPVVPHAVQSLGRQDCLNCHREGMDLGEEGMAPRTPHPERVNCRQCHVEQVEPGTVGVDNGFEGLRHAKHGRRAYPGAPPLLPHPRNGREGCLGCHGTGGGSPIRTPHPDGVNCLQCHVEPVPGAGSFQVAAAGNDDEGGRP